MKDPGIELKHRFDGMLFSLVIALSGISVFLLLSINKSQAKDYWIKQLMWFGLGLAGTIGVTMVPQRTWYRMAYFIYPVLLFPLLLVSASAKGAERWFALGGFHFQPSEFAKIGVLLALARVFSGRKIGWDNLKDLVAPFLLFIVPFLLILKQPNLSTALAVGTVFVTMLYWSGFGLLDLLVLFSPLLSVGFSFERTLWGVWMLFIAGFLFLRTRSGLLPRKLMLLFFLINLAMGMASQIAWNNVLKSHQRSRILTFLDPTREPGGAGYQVLQSQVAIGSGGLFGKGFGQGSQSNLNFVPEEHTDFIFAVLSEQFGFVGCAIVLALFYAFLARALRLCFEFSNRFLNLVAVGCVAIFSFHIVVNISMTLGLMPVTGLPLPFLSYGGSFVIASMLLVGFLLHIRLGDED
ncbi:MAG: hypothetical protein RL318_704 [Fibrobacterota bacterium]|jgi:rod shape determining protein RodA